MQWFHWRRSADVQTLFAMLTKEQHRSERSSFLFHSVLFERLFHSDLTLDASEIEACDLFSMWLSCVFGRKITPPLHRWSTRSINRLCLAGDRSRSKDVICVRQRCDDGHSSRQDSVVNNGVSHFIHWAMRILFLDDWSFSGDIPGQLLTSLLSVVTRYSYWLMNARLHSTTFPFSARKKKSHLAMVISFLSSLAIAILHVGASFSSRWHETIFVDKRCVSLRWQLECHWITASPSSRTSSFRSRFNWSRWRYSSYLPSSVVRWLQARRTYSCNNFEISSTLILNGLS